MSSKSNNNKKKVDNTENNKLKRNVKEDEFEEELDDDIENLSENESDEEIEEINSENSDEESEEELDEESEDENDNYDNESKDDDNEECLYNIKKKKKGKSKDVDSDGEYDEDFFFEETDELPNNQNLVLTGNDRITKPFLTKYERVRILGERAKQLSMGAKPMLKNIIGIKHDELAKLELENKVIPYKIRRPLPDGRIEIWKINELTIL